MLIQKLPDIFDVGVAIFGSHTIKDTSSDALTIFFPSGVNCPAVTVAEWPAKTFIHSPDGTFS